MTNSLSEMANIANETAESVSSDLPGTLLFLYYIQ